MNYQIRLAKEADLPDVVKIYSNARAFMANRGNASQWGTHYPPVEQTEEDIAGGMLYVLSEDETIHGVFSLIRGEDPTYREIYNGAWHYDLPYAAIHRVAGDGSGGIVSAMINHVLVHHDYIRIDTHEHNLPMQRALARTGFVYCGTILTDDGTPRLAFDLKK